MVTRINSGELILILGGARSGKSSFAQKLAAAQDLAVTYVATALPLDGEMEWRIAKHRETRPASWRTIEAPYSADAAVVELCGEEGVVIWDCVTVFLTNLLLEAEEKGESADLMEARILQRFEAMLSRLEDCPGTLIIVSNETGLGIVPEYPLGRSFRDLAGRVNQLIAMYADKVFFVVAGLPLEIKEHAYVLPNI